MIKVIRIAGESYDLETLAEIPKALVISNGRREVFIPVDDHVATAVLEMMIETRSEVQGVSASAPPKQPVLMKQEAASAKLPKTPRKSTKKMLEDPAPVVMALVEDQVQEALEEVIEQFEREPGEEYNDPSTGVASL